MSHWSENVSGNLAPGDYGYIEASFSSHADFGVGSLLTGSYEIEHYPDTSIDPRFSAGFTLAARFTASRAPHQTINQFVGVAIKMRTGDGVDYEVYARARGYLAAGETEAEEAAVEGTGGEMDWFVRTGGVNTFPSTGNGYVVGEPVSSAPVGLSISSTGYVTASFNGGTHAFPSPFDLSLGIDHITLRLDHQVQRSGTPATGSAHPVSLTGELEIGNLPINPVLGPCLCPPYVPLLPVDCELLDDFDRTESSGWGTMSYRWPVSNQHPTWFVGAGCTSAVSGGHATITLNSGISGARGAFSSQVSGYGPTALIPDGYPMEVQTTIRTALVTGTPKPRLSCTNAQVEVNMATGQIVVTRFGGTNGTATLSHPLMLDTEYGLALEVTATTAIARIWDVVDETYATATSVTSSAAVTPTTNHLIEVGMQLIGSGTAYTVTWGPVRLTPCDRPIALATRRASLSWVVSRTLTGTFDSGGVLTGEVTAGTSARPSSGNWSVVVNYWDPGNGDVLEESRQWASAVVPPEATTVRFNAVAQPRNIIFTTGPGVPFTTTETLQGGPLLFSPTLAPVTIDVELDVLGPDYNDGLGYVSKLFQWQWWDTTTLFLGFHATSVSGVANITYETTAKYPGNAPHDTPGIGDYDYRVGEGAYTLTPTNRMWVYGQNGGTYGDINVPLPNQEVQEELVGYGDGITASFTADWPYVPQSLDVSVDHIHVPADQSAPEAGTFTLGFVPDVGEAVRATYRYQEPP